MTYEEVIEKYAETDMNFVQYYKYSFTYSGTAEDGSEITISTGGDSGDIYKQQFSAKEKLGKLWPNYITLVNKDTKIEVENPRGW